MRRKRETESAFICIFSFIFRGGEQRVFFKDVFLFLLFIGMGGFFYIFMDGKKPMMVFGFYFRFSIYDVVVVFTI